MNFTILHMKQNPKVSINKAWFNMETKTINARLSQGSITAENSEESFLKLCFETSQWVIAF